MKSKSLRKQLEQLSLGDLVAVEWNDASIGKSLSSGVGVDVPVRSWGVFIGVLGEKSKHIVVAQNSFKYANGLFDLDYTAIPLSWTTNVVVIAKNYVEPNVANQLINSFLMGGRRAFPTRSRQQKVRNHDRLD